MLQCEQPILEPIIKNKLQGKLLMIILITFTFSSLPSHCFLTNVSGSFLRCAKQYR